MNSSGIIRRVDELGRIVIPVEIRRLLNIKEGEKLEFIINNEYICLKKKSYVQSSYNVIDSISRTFNSVIDGDYFISDREKVIKSSNEDLINSNISVELSNLLDKHEDSIITSGIIINKTSIKNTVYVYPYYLLNDIAGFICIYNVESIEKYKKLVKFISGYIHDEISII